MSKFLAFEISQSNPLPFILLFDDRAIDQLAERELYKDSLIYFICKVKKIRFDLSTLEIDNDKIKINLTCHGRTNLVSCSIGEGKKPIYHESSSSKKLEFIVEGSDSPRLVITPDTEFRKLKQPASNKPEIIYIGYSFDPIRRLRSHEKIVRACAEIEDDEEIRIYINSFKFSYMETLPGKILVAKHDIGIKRGVISDELLKKYVKMVERISIHFFQTEGLNDNHINMNIMTDDILKELLQETGIRFFGGGLEMNEEYFDFWTRNQIRPYKSFFFDFENPQRGYLSQEQTRELFLS